MLVARGIRLVAQCQGKPLIGTAVVSTRKISYLPKKGTGGRSSFNGVSATVFGATGFLGRYVINRLGRVGTQLTVPYRGDEHDIRHLRLMGDLGQIDFFDFHLKDEESIAKMVKHSNVVVNLIGRGFETRNFNFEEVHVDGARTIAKAAKEAGVERLIHVSALNAAVDSPSKFLHTKALGEQAVREEFPNATILRPGTVFGHEDKFLNYYAYLRSLPLGIPLIEGGMNTKKMPVYVADVAQSILEAIKEEASVGQTFELVGPSEYYLYDIIDYIYRVMKCNFKHYTVPRKAYELMAWGFEWSIFNPRLTRDMLYRQFQSDALTPGLPGLEDLGIKPTPLGAEAIAVLRRHRQSYYYEEAIDEDEVCRKTASYQ
ncbi:predicted protein [Nematostella vectensis]|uniref:NADH dehydrogenase [ubiquinone] 1 alpha subcomplex subunit 9, mitochondrial n=1 Tax=Nematostella vectensis TaxID=45351 RepID=A7SNV3_NEMVE|nr:predicted protein [Nematostella vectensis]|eukprot:XP_001626712.1 predicted protein [Nematostella vectensis]